MAPFDVTVVKTTPFEGQKPGTSGLRKKTKVFMQEHYLENFVQASFTAILSEGTKVQGGTLVVSGDGRYHNDKAIQTIVKMAAAHGVGRIWIGERGLLSTPAVSAVIRQHEGGFKAFGAFILTASHNPGGLDEDFGIKYNCENGGPAPEGVTDKIFANTKSIAEYRSCLSFPDVDISGKAKQVKVEDAGRAMTIEVFDSTADQIDLLLTGPSPAFDIAALRKLIARKDFSMRYDSLHGVQGPYARRVFVELLGADPASLMNCEPRPDFGGPHCPSHGHADPNLKNAAELCTAMGVDGQGRAVTGQKQEPPAFGAAADGDADRNMILGSRFFVTPSDSLAILVNNAEACIPYFRGGLKGCARSMPTSGAMDLVAKKKGIPYFETPTGWKFFGNLMDSACTFKKTDYTPFICGEESFGTGSNHVREKDGLWAVLAWLSVLAHRNPDAGRPLVGVQQIVEEHWREYGRHYYARYDYEGVDKAKAEAMMARLVAQCGSLKGKAFGAFQVSDADEFEYRDPVDGSVSAHQGIRLFFADGSRVIFRLSGTGVEGATIRVYLEKYQPCPAGGDADVRAALGREAQEVVKPLAAAALAISDLAAMTGRNEPSVIT